MTKVATASEPPRSGPPKARLRRRTVVLVALLGLVLLLVFVAAWIGIRGLQAKTELEAALPLVSQVQEDAASGDLPGAQDAVATLAQHTASAHALTSDPIWRMASVLPLAGPNLRGFGELAAVTDSIVQGVMVPATSAGLLDASFLKPVDGRFDLDAVAELETVFDTASTALDDGYARLQALDTSGAVSQIQDAHAQLEGLVEPLVPVMAGADGLVRMLPTLLGGEGERRYLLVFQNNAEARALGGHTGAWVELLVNDGRITINRQINVNPIYSPLPAIDLTTEQVALWPGAGIRPSNTTMIPDLELSARTASGYWNNAFGVRPDAVFFQDPVALGYVLGATGPVSLPNGESIDAATAATFLLSGVYLQYSENEEQDVVFAAVVENVFSAVLGGNFDPAKFLAAALAAGEEHRLLAWFFDEEEMAALEGLPFLTVPSPVIDAETARFGLYITDNLGSKMTYYLDTSVELSQQVCGDEGRYRVRVTFTNLATPELGAVLPWYVGALQGGDMRILATLYAPPGSTIVGATGWDGDFAPITATDGEYPAMAQRLVIPAETSVAAEFIVESADVDLTRELEAYVTPLARPGQVSTVDWAC